MGVGEKKESQKVAVITGASSGIGLECALMLLDQGYKVYALSRHATLCVALNHALCESIDIDVSDSNALKEVFLNISAKEDHCDVLINSAGYGVFGSVEDTPIEEVKKQFGVNFFALCEVVQFCLPLLKNKPYSKIFNLSSIAGRVSMLFLGHYSASKHALEAYSDALRLELKPFNVQVCLIEPGPVKSNWEKTAFENDERKDSVYALDLEKTKNFYSGVYQKALSAKAVAQKIVFLSMSQKIKARYLIGLKTQLLLALYRILPSSWYDSLFRLIVLKRKRDA
ncbi:SDR family oxidoreductase [Helicobacter pylori]|uniref:SDR family oxidoreductase n=1 Tax=Helicobacter pylori TaxID=210 RepID=UPI0012E892B2|nr:SDR family oxidoreductase [Helicobacter pylori]MUU23402.1 SDR family oxidoreductase [Helicobacter pylori]MUU38002.1 SDR family oxidoreductase [Helicobacter pylori]MUU81240.1 SDR family oxidoreductase [Helicobacter pylori]MUU89169.1 SDR family oxidoreductase [Helicobacter pylori]WQV72032.1 SDR family oxidoreductase [Helicobacter pylori]